MFIKIMGDNQPGLNSNNSLFLISLLAYGTFSAQFILRAFDDNHLINWQWAFQNINAASIFLILMACLIPALFIAKLSIPVRIYPLVLFASAFVAAAFFWSESEAIVDSSRYFTQAKHLELYGISYFLREWGRDINAWTDMPVVPFLYGLVFRIFGESRIGIQILTTTLYSFSAVLTYELGRTLWDEETGFFAGTFILGIPYLLTQVPLMLVDVPAMFFLMLAVVTFTRALEKGAAWRILSASMAFFLAFFTKYSTWLMLSILAVIFLVYMLQGAGDRAKRAEIVLRGLSIAGIAAFFCGVFFLYKFDVFRDQMRLLIDFQKPGLYRWQESFVSTFFFQTHPFITLASLYSAYIAIRKKDLKYVVIVWLVLLMVLMQIKRTRYIIMVFPMLALMAAYGIRGIRGRDIKNFIALSVVISSLTIGIFAYRPFMLKISTVNFRDAGKFVDSLREPNVEVFTLRTENPVVNPSVSVPLLDLFTKKNIVYAYNPESFAEPAATVEKSSLRFTWEYRNPRYYSDKKYPDKDTAVIVISSSPDDTLSGDIRRRISGYRLAGIFETTEGIFAYRPYVRVYREIKSGEETYTSGRP